MGKDGTLRGGTRAGAGRKAKFDAEKEMQIVESAALPDLTGSAMPPVRKYLSAKQHQSMERLTAKDIFKATWEWLSEQKCEKAVSPQLIESYSMAAARNIQAERAISKYGFLGRHPTTGEAMESPYVKIADKYAKQANILWMQIQQIVREKGTGDIAGMSYDSMEDLMKEAGC